MNSQAKDVGINPSIIVAKKGKFRLHTIGKFVGIKEHKNGKSDFCFENRPISEGLGVECKIDDQHYIVIAFIKVDSDGDCLYESVGSRIEDNIDNYDCWLDFREIIKKGFIEVEKAFKKSK